MIDMDNSLVQFITDDSRLIGLILISTKTNRLIVCWYSSFLYDDLTRCGTMTRCREIKYWRSDRDRITQDRGHCRMFHDILAEFHSIGEISLFEIERVECVNDLVGMEVALYERGRRLGIRAAVSGTIYGLLCLLYTYR